MWDAISCGKAQQMKTECTHDYLGHADGGDGLPPDPGPVERTQVVEVWKGGKVLGAEDEMMQTDRISRFAGSWMKP